MADSFIQLPPDSTGKKLDAEEAVVGSNTVHRQRVSLRGTDWSFTAGGSNTAVDYTYPGTVGKQFFVTGVIVTWAGGPTTPQLFTLNDGGAERIKAWAGPEGLVLMFANPVTITIGNGIRVTIGAGGIGNSSQINVFGYSVV